MVISKQKFHVNTGPILSSYRLCHYLRLSKQVFIQNFTIEFTMNVQNVQLSHSTHPGMSVNQACSTHQFII